MGFMFAQAHRLVPFDDPTGNPRKLSSSGGDPRLQHETPWCAMVCADD